MIKQGKCLGVLQFLPFQMIFSFIKYIYQFLLNKGKISLRNPQSGSHLFHKYNRCNDSHYYYTLLIYYMFISCVHLILTHDASCERGARGPAARAASAFVPCSCSAPATWEFSRDRGWPRLRTAPLPECALLRFLTQNSASGQSLEGR